MSHGDPAVHREHEQSVASCIASHCARPAVFAPHNLVVGARGDRASCVPVHTHAEPSHRAQRMAADAQELHSAGKLSFCLSLFVPRSAAHADVDLLTGPCVRNGGRLQQPLSSSCRCSSSSSFSFSARRLRRPRTRPEVHTLYTWQPHLFPSLLRVACVPFFCLQTCAARFRSHHWTSKGRWLVRTASAQRPSRSTARTPPPPSTSTSPSAPSRTMSLPTRPTPPRERQITESLRGSNILLPYVRCCLSLSLSLSLYLALFLSLSLFLSLFLSLSLSFSLSLSLSLSLSIPLQPRR
jgi:hypothetical protein